MSACWECEQSLVTRAQREVAWAYLTDMDNHARMENVTIELDGPFETGTMGRTISAGLTQEWELTGVVKHERFGVTGYTADRQGFLCFSWCFEELAQGTKITYRIKAQGPDVEQHPEVIQDLAEKAPLGLKAFVDALDQLATE